MKKVIAFFVLIVFTPNLCFGAIAFDASSHLEPVVGTPQSFNHTVTGSNPILFCSTYENNNVSFISGVTYNSVSMTELANVTGNAITNRLWYLINPSTGTHSVTITANAGGMTTLAICASYTGAKQSGVPDAFTTEAKSDTTFTETLTTVADNAWTVITDINGLNTVAGTNTTQRAVGTRSFIGDSNGPITPAGSHSMTVTQDSGFGSVIMASFAPFVASSPSVKVPDIISDGIDW